MVRRESDTIRLPFFFMTGRITSGFLFLLLLVFAAWNAVAADRPNVIVVTLDTVRADRMGFLGSQRGLTPQMDAVARQGVVFERAYAQAPLTPVAHATIFTGTYPPYHKVHDFGNRLGDQVPFLPDLLRARGYRTAAFVSSIILDPKNGFAPGFDRGFNDFDGGFQRRARGKTRYESVERRAEQTIARVLAWLENNDKAPFFLWVHIWDAHDPYEPPAPYNSRYAANLYDGEIAYLDAALGKLFAALRARGLYDNALIAVVSDHGESLGDHGESTHGVFLYDQTIHVPLVFKFPQGRYAGQRVRSRVGQVDIAPTILDAVQLPVPPVMQGQSLVRMVGVTTAAADRPSYAETEYPRRAFGWSPLKSLRTANFLYVKAPEQELYDSAADPQATRNLVATKKAEVARIAAQLEAFLQRVGANAPEAQQSEMNPRTREKLASLGYVAGARGAVRDTGIDPKTRIQVANDLHDANIAIEDGRAGSVIPQLERVVSSDPQIQAAQFYLGVAYARQRQFAKAIGPLRKAIELQPDAVMAHYEMGLALFETGDWKTAATHFEIVVDHNPKWTDARFSLAAVYARIDRVPDAMALLLTVLEQNPEHYRANLLMGRLLTLKGQVDLAVPHLEKAAQLQPDSSEAHAFLADAYQRLGRSADAQRERARAEALKRPPSP